MFTRITPEVCQSNILPRMHPTLTQWDNMVNSGLTPANFLYRHIHRLLAQITDILISGSNFFKGYISVHYLYIVTMFLCFGFDFGEGKDFRVKFLMLPPLIIGFFGVLFMPSKAFYSILFSMLGATGKIISAGFASFFWVFPVCFLLFLADFVSVFEVVLFALFGLAFLTDSPYRVKAVESLCYLTNRAGFYWVFRHINTPEKNVYFLSLKPFGCWQTTQDSFSGATLASNLMIT